MPKVSLNKQNQEHWNGNRIMCEECTLNMIKWAGVAAGGAAQLRGYSRMPREIGKIQIPTDFQIWGFNPSRITQSLGQGGHGSKGGETFGVNGSRVHNESGSAT